MKIKATLGKPALEHLTASDGWLDKWKFTRDIQEKQYHAESMEVSEIILDDEAELFDNLLSEQLIFKRISCVQWLFWGYLAKLKRGLGLAFGAHFLHDFSIKMFLI